MDIEYLHEFLSTAETLNFSRAAENLCISQSALSRHISALEDDLCVKLLRRSRQNVELTSEGEFARAEFANIYDSYQHVKEVFRKREKDRYSLVIGGHTEDSNIVLHVLAAIRTVREELPQSHITIATGEGPTLESCEKLLSAGSIDCAIRQSGAFHITKDFPDIDAFKVGGLSGIALVGKKHPLASYDEITFDQLNGQTLIRIVGDKFQQSWTSLSNQLAHRNVAYNVRHVSAPSYLDAFNIDIGDSVLLFPNSDLAALAMLSSDYKAVPIAASEHFCFPYCVISRKGNTSVVLKAFVKAFREQLSSED